MTTNTDATFIIFDAAGNRPAMDDEHGVIRFDRHADAVSFLASKSLDPRLYVITLDDSLTYCEGCEAEDAPLNVAGYCPACVFAAKRGR